MSIHVLQIGINNYPGTKNDLAGCLNDLKDLRALLPKKLASHAVLKDEQATLVNILQSIQSFVRLLKAGDWGILQYSGHGSWEPDKDGDEPDRRDECWVPYDWANGVLDDTLQKFWHVIDPKARLLLLTDSCMNGTVFRKLLSSRSSDTKQPRVRFISPEQRLDEAVQWLAGSAGSAAKLKKARRVATRPIPDKKEKPLPTVIHLAGSRNTEYCSDAYFKGRPNGAFTRMLVDIRKSVAGPLTVGDLHAKLLEVLPSSNYPQTPVLNATAANKKLALPF